MQIAVIGRNGPRGTDPPGDVAFHAPVLDPARIDVHRTAVDREGLDHVVAVDVEDVDSVGEGAAEEPLRERKFVVHQFLGLQVRILRREHIHLADGRKAESLADHRLDLGVAGQQERQPALGNPLRARMRMVVEAQPGVERQPVRQALAEIDVSRHFVHRFVGRGLVRIAVEIAVPGLAPEVLVVDTHGQTVAREERRTLIPRHAQHPVAGIEAVIERFGAGRIAVVDLVTAPVVEKAQGAGGLSVVVAQRE